MTEKRVLMHYDKDQDRWCVPIGDRSYDPYCGEGFQLYVGRQSFVCRIELDTSWYIITKEVKFTFHERQKYVVRLL